MAVLRSHAEPAHPRATTFDPTVSVTVASPPTPSPTLEPTAMPTPSPTPEPTVGVSAASVGSLAPVATPTAAPTRPAPPAPRVDGVPWYVPARWAEEYRACLDNPERHDRTTWILTVDWPQADAEYIADHEGGWDLCQFNTQGSGACGWFQLLPCPPDGLTPEGQIRGAYAKYLDGGRSFYRHWLQWWH